MFGAIQQVMFCIGLKPQLEAFSFLGAHMPTPLSSYLLDLIMSYEDPEKSEVSLQLYDGGDSEHHIYFFNPKLSTSDNNILAMTNENRLFSFHEDIPFYCSFKFESSLSLSNLFAEAATLKTRVDQLDSEKLRSNLVWFKMLVQRVKEQAGSFLFSEILNSVLIDISVRFYDDDGVIVLCFSKHSPFLNKNIHFNFYFDMEFNFKSVKFNCFAHQDNYQQESLQKFKPENQLLAFQLLLSYYCYPQIHAQLDDLIDVSTDLTDTNLADYAHLAHMLSI